MARPATWSDLKSRFVAASDPYIEKLKYGGEITHWSRPYEYEWLETIIKHLTAEGDHIIDAGSGPGAPFSKHLGGTRRLIAIDVDEAMPEMKAWRSMVRIRADILDENAYSEVPVEHVLSCSVLEHMPPADIAKFFKTMAKVNPGFLFITLDVPRVNLTSFFEWARAAGWVPAYGLDTELPFDVLNGLNSIRADQRYEELHVFRAVLHNPGRKSS